MAYKDYMSHDRNTEGWTLEEGYPSTAKKDTFPRRAMSAGSSAGLFLLITAYQQDLDYICKGPVQGFKARHECCKPVRVIIRRYLELVMSINPDMMTTSPGLRNYDAHRRQCYFPDEKHLTFFRYYTQQNCQVECLTNYTSAKCGCVAYHMPRKIQMSRLTLYFKEQQFITSERNELYGLTDFLANCGGILGLFIGFSFLSIVEVFYFLTLRLVCNVKIYGRRYWSGSSNLMKQYGNAHD
ncbi:hypothetical protein NQ318_020412 [Aromia moschata]|uniref:Uncharacterized protein n=1 Tax=Aromia moschata TaxID=1265417 RepID=A0AAV8YIY2_9CUCU|nr:hypothetical protein NQ318_020412 [Aromia moschata]